MSLGKEMKQLHIVLQESRQPFSIEILNKRLNFKGINQLLLQEVI